MLINIDNINKTITDELTPRYGEEKVKKELNKYRKFLGLIYTENGQIFDSLWLFVLYCMYAVSFYYEIHFLDVNILRALPISMFILYLCDKFLIDIVIKINIVFGLILLLSLVNLYVLQSIDISIFVGFLMLPYNIVRKKILLRRNLN